MLGVIMINFEHVLGEDRVATESFRYVEMAVVVFVDFENFVWSLKGDFGVPALLGIVGLFVSVCCEGIVVCLESEGEIFEVIVDSVRLCFAVIFDRGDSLSVADFNRCGLVSFKRGSIDRVLCSPKLVH